MKTLITLFSVVVLLLAGTLPSTAAYDKGVEKALKKDYKDVTYVSHADCYMVMSKKDKDYYGICKANGDVLIQPNYKKISFERADDGSVIIFALHPNIKAESQGNLVYSMKGKIMDMGKNEPQYVPGGYLSSYGKPIYNMSGDIVLDCQQSSVQPIRHGANIIAYRVATRGKVNNATKEELLICGPKFNKLFTLEGQAYMWKVEETTSPKGEIEWKCTKSLGANDVWTMIYSADGKLLDDSKQISTPTRFYAGSQNANQPSQNNQGSIGQQHMMAQQQAYAQPQQGYAQPQQGYNQQAYNQAPVGNQQPMGYYQQQGQVYAQNVPQQPQQQPQEPVVEEKEEFKSDVDINPPVTSQTAENTFAVIISNENYTEVEPVKYALNDGESVANYFEKTLGIPNKNIRFVKDATLNNMRKQLNWLQQIADVVGKEAKVIFYYSGHGVPDEQSKDAYLMPVDGYHSDMSTNLSINQLYEQLSALDVAQVTVLMDACFSGSQRGDNMLVAARGVKIKSKANEPKGKLVVFSAAQSDETAYPLEDQHHGMFTYYLLKKLQSSGSSVSLGELQEYITAEVKKASLLQNGKLQTPSTAISPVLQETWKDATL